MNPVVEFKPIDPKGPGLTCNLGPGFIMPSVTGGWQTIQRPRRKSLTDFVGADPVSMDIPIIFDGHASGRSVEPSIRALYHMMREQVGDRDTPPIISLRKFPVPFPTQEWVIQGISVGDEIRRSSDGNRTQAQFTVTVLEYVAGDILTRHKHHKEHKRRTKTYIVRKGDTLQKISVREYGVAKDWHKIASANNIRDPQHLKVGHRLKIPLHG